MHEANIETDINTVVFETEGTRPGQELSDGVFGIARDMKSGDLTDEQVLDLFDSTDFISRGIYKNIIMKQSRESLLKTMRADANTIATFVPVIDSGEINTSVQAVNEMIDRFEENDGSLNNVSGVVGDNLTNDAGYTNFINDIKQSVSSQAEDILNQKEVSNLGIRLPVLSTGGNFFNWNGSWYGKVSMLSANFKCEKFSIKVEVEVADNFGLDDGDLFDGSTNANISKLLPGMQAWFRLQRVLGFQPFVNSINENIIVTGDIK